MHEAWERSEGSPGAPTAAEVREAERFCRRMARREAKNFYWGFVSLPRQQRTAIYALYDFARQVDDEADGGGSAAGLRRHRERARGCALGLHSDPVTLVLARAMDRYGIPERELQDLIDGVEMDLVRTRYATWGELERYCRLVASTVGRMCVRVFGFDAPVALELADQLGIALQLTNILRDVREDASMGRVYLPAEDLDRFGVGEEELLAGRPGPGWEALVAFEAGRARGYFERGLGVLRHIPRRPAACVGTMAGIYRTILGRIEREPRLPLRRRASLSPARKLALVMGSWVHLG
ncbi:MAG TPA: squalene/phytoene synthase family protein [Candidatus Dormibacteraeota bacterium]|nr:squalene/phytoene synthase family protein [Candidatus Dormibacteraeota bacterium]